VNAVWEAADALGTLAKVLFGLVVRHGEVWCCCRC
jgi:hypothetical protein